METDIRTRQQLEKVISSHLVIGESRIFPSTKVKNLGSWFDPNLDMISHVNNICSSSFHYLYNMRRIRKYFSHQSARLSKNWVKILWVCFFNSGQIYIYYMYYISIHQSPLDCQLPISDFAYKLWQELIKRMGTKLRPQCNSWTVQYSRKRKLPLKSRKTLNWVPFL